MSPTTYEVGSVVVDIQFSKDEPLSGYSSNGAVGTDYYYNILMNEEEEAYPVVNTTLTLGGAPCLNSTLTPKSSSEVEYYPLEM